MAITSSFAKRCDICGSTFYYFGDYSKKICDPCRAKTEKFIKRTWRANVTRAEKMGLPATLTLDQWKRTLIHFDYRCAYCGEPYTLLEHFISVEAGGGTTANNCVPACSSCNAHKANRVRRVTGSREINRDGYLKVWHYLSTQ